MGRSSPPLFAQILGFEEYQVYRCPAGYETPLNHFGFAPGGRILLATHAAGGFLWDTSRGRMLASLGQKAINYAFFHPDELDLYAVTSYGLLRWPWRAAVEDSRLEINLGPPHCYPLSYGLGQGTFATETREVLIEHVGHLHRIHAGKPDSEALRPIDLQQDRMQLSSDGIWLAAWTRARNEIILMTRGDSKSDWQEAARFAGSAHFAFSPDCQMLITCWDHSYRFWSLESLAELDARRLPLNVSGPPDGPLACAPLPSQGRGTLLAVADGKFTIRLFEVETDPHVPHRLLATLESPSQFPTRSMEFNHDGSRLAVARSDQTLEVWNLRRIGLRLEPLGLQDQWPQWPEEFEPVIQLTLTPGEPNREIANHYWDLEDYTR